MARQPFYGQTPGIQTRGIDMQVATQGARDMARGMAQFGEAIGGSIQKFREKKEREKDEGEAENALLSMGLPPEVAKSASKDKNVLGAFMQQKQIEVYQDRVDAQREALKHSAGAIEAQQRKAKGQLARDFFFNEDDRGQTQFDKQFGGQLGNFVTPDLLKGKSDEYLLELRGNMEELGGNKSATDHIANWASKSDPNYANIIGDPTHPKWTDHFGRLMANVPRGAETAILNFVNTARSLKQSADRQRASTELGDIPPSETIFDPGTPAFDANEDGKVDENEGRTKLGVGVYTSPGNRQFVPLGKESSGKPPAVVQVADAVEKALEKGDIQRARLLLADHMYTTEGVDFENVRVFPQIFEDMFDQARIPIRP